jgi:2-polyprenyl-3-methyl-5-hydroxy-6-metoxy-1,4-benzoquinol methylase
MLPRRLSAGGGEAVVKRETGESFAYEWSRFGQPRPEWRANFLDYLRPHAPEWLAGKRVLDVGTGSGRHANVAAELGAEVVAVDLGDSIDVARANLPDRVPTIQADAEALPFTPETFDLVMSIGVLHHLPDPERALRSLVRYVRPGGHLHVYLYWQPPHRGHRAILRMVTGARRVTTRMPHRLLHALCYPLAALLWVLVVQPYRVLRPTRLRRLAEAFPLKTYADYPFGVLLNDQFDRFSAPIEHRYTAAEVERMLRDAGLRDIVVLPNHGWIGDGRRPEEAQS